MCRVVEVLEKHEATQYFTEYNAPLFDILQIPTSPTIARLTCGAEIDLSSLP